MCGIAGYVDFDKNTDPSVIKKMTDSISYRGPDSSGKFTSPDKSAGLGIRRLSIIDLKTGDQPILNEDKTVAVVYNGEIYNYRDLRVILENDGHKFTTQSDTEVIVHGYEKWGESVVGKLNGMFAFALWDDKNKKLLIGRDRSGIKPLYYYHAGNQLVFASELKAILKFPGIKNVIDHESLSEYLFVGFVSSGRSIFSDVVKLPPGYFLTFQNSHLSLKKYFSLEISNSTQFENLDHLMDRVVSDQLVSDVPIGVFLSGGLDSSLISYYVSKHKKLNSFSIGFSEPGFDESDHAHYVARMIKTSHHSEEFVPRDVENIFSEITKLLDEPISDPSLIPTFKVCRLARKYVKVVLSGDGGDELFGGYPTYQAHILAGYFDRLPKIFPDIAENIINLIPDSLLKYLPLSFQDYPKKKLAKIVLNGMKFNNPQRHLYWMKTFFLGDQKLTSKNSLGYVDKLDITGVGSKFIGQVIDFSSYLPEDFLVKVDRASSFNSLEVRVPYLDNRIIDYAFSYKRNHLNLLKTKLELRELLTKNLPQIAKRKKKGFGIPLNNWLRLDLKDFAYSYLTDKKLIHIIPKTKIQKLWKDHQGGISDNSGVIWQLVVLSGWLQNWT